VIDIRIFSDWSLAYDEIKRNLNEAGTKVELYSMQDKVVQGNPDFVTKEILGECYALVGVRSNDIKLWMKKNKYSEKELEWIDEEFEERVSPEYINPGDAWRLRENIWKPFLRRDKKFSYSYNQRIRRSLDVVIEELMEHPTTRQAVLPIFDYTDNYRASVDRIPCSLCYSFFIRDNELDMFYVMRSADIITHFPFDVCLALIMQEFIASAVGIKPGKFLHFLMSAHCYSRDVAGFF
jgi:thymidylate synthase